MIKYFLTCLFCLAILPLLAQEFSGGFRAGLNFITFDGDMEMDASGMSLESFNRTTGFHVGATFAYELTDLFGFKADLMYSQKGAEVIYEGPSFFYLYADNEDREGEAIRGQLSSERDVLNSYIDIPVVAYYRIGPLEVEGGVSVGFLVNSRASGSANYTNIRQPAAFRNTGLIVNYDYNYFQNSVGNAAVLERSETPLPGTQVFPPSVIDAYYNHADNEPLYRRFDFGLVGGLAYFLNNGLYLGVRYQIGLSDTTRPDNDLRLTREDNEGDQRQFNEDDEDFNRTIQASVGFRF